MIRKFLSWFEPQKALPGPLVEQMEEEPVNKREMHRQLTKSKQQLEQFIDRNEAGAMLILSPRASEPLEEMKEEEDDEAALSSKYVTMTNDKNQKVEALIVYPKRSIQRVVHQQEVIQRCLKKAQIPAALELQCPICLDLFINPVMACCGHVFCNECYTEATLSRKECSVCRKNIRQRQPIECRTFASLVEQVISNDSEEKARYAQRKEELRRLEIKRRLTHIQPGEELDARDTEYIWCPAVVRMTMNIHKKGVFLVIHYLGWSNVYDEAIPIDSRRLSSKGFYTKRRDIPRYILQNRRGNNYYAHIAHDPDEDDFDMSLPLLGGARASSFLETQRRFLERPSEGVFRHRSSSLLREPFSIHRDNPFRHSSIFQRWRNNDQEGFRRSPLRSFHLYPRGSSSSFLERPRENPFISRATDSIAHALEDDIHSAEQPNNPGDGSTARMSEPPHSCEAAPQTRTAANIGSPHLEEEAPILPVAEMSNQQGDEPVPIPMPDITAPLPAHDPFTFSFRSLTSENGNREESRDEPHPLLESERNQRIGSDWLSHQENRLRRDAQENRDNGDGVSLELVQLLRNGRRNIFEHLNHPNRNS